MLLGIKSTKIALVRHLSMAVIAGLLIYATWHLNRDWGGDHSIWKALGGASFFLLWYAVFIGPAAVVWPALNRICSYRREAGVWFFIVGLAHGLTILDGWVRWGFWEFFGYQYFPQVEMYLRVESGFGIANFAGLIALVLGLFLAATSFDRAVSFLGVSSWKWLHAFAYVIFYLGVVHVVYFAFIHFDPSLQRAVMEMPNDYPDNPLRYLYLAAMVSVVVAQVWAYVKTVRKQKESSW